MTHSVVTLIIRFALHKVLGVHNFMPIIRINTHITRQVMVGGPCHALKVLLFFFSSDNIVTATLLSLFCVFDSRTPALCQHQEKNATTVTNVKCLE